MCRGCRLARLLRWCLTIIAPLAAASSGLSFFYGFGIIRTVAYLDGSLPPSHTAVGMWCGVLIYVRGEAMAHTPRQGPYRVAGMHWSCNRIRPEDRIIWWRPTLQRDHIEVPPWLVV